MKKRVSVYCSSTSKSSDCLPVCQQEGPYVGFWICICIGNFIAITISPPCKTKESKMFKNRFLLIIDKFPLDSHDFDPSSCSIQLGSEVYGVIPVPSFVRPCFQLQVFREGLILSRQQDSLAKYVDC